MKRGHIGWLYEELPALVRTGVLTEADAVRLRTHYGAPPARAGRTVAVIICSVLGAALIGGGVILLLAHNWSALSRPQRTTLALLPLIALHALSGWAILRGRTTTAWREGLGTALALAAGAAIALIGQTYHLPGDLGSFLLTWMLLTIPIVYVLEATAPAILFFAGITGWAASEQATGAQAALFWPLLALAVPHACFAWRRQPHGIRLAWLSWGFCLCLCIALGVVLEKALPGLWLVCYGALFSCFYLAWPATKNAPDGMWRNPLRTVGAVGTSVLALLLTYEWPWREIGWSAYRWDRTLYPLAAFMDYLVAAGLLAAATLLLVRRTRRDSSRAPLGAGFIVTSAGFACASAEYETAAMLLCNAYLLGAGLLLLFEGVRRMRLSTLNGGLALVAGLALARFFDSDLGFTVRGVVFIVVGIVFLAANVVMIRRARQEST